MGIIKHRIKQPLFKYSIGRRSKYFVGTNSGILHTNDNGITWTTMNSGLGSPIVMTMAKNGTSIFAGTYGNGVYVSSNNGAFGHSPVVDFRKPSFQNFIA
ncbi:MAG: hypothetical protein IPK10_02450 [Bacteroidetes bacterium]|nr:hypothetical protein [Bacteroidota bacterium]